MCLFYRMKVKRADDSEPALVKSVLLPCHIIIKFLNKDLIGSQLRFNFLKTEWKNKKCYQIFGSKRPRNPLYSTKNSLIIHNAFHYN